MPDHHQDWNEFRRVIDTNVTGTVYLLHTVGKDMRTRGSGRIQVDSLRRRIIAGFHKSGGRETAGRA
jgi:NAD(P)-dependent dehydrogenase (short-subunit alcohol dehydrogenase family)